MDNDAAAAEALLARWGVKRGPTEKQLATNVLWTSLLDGGLIALLLVLLLIGAEFLSLQSIHCGADPSCDGEQIAIASTVLVAGMLTVFVLAVGVSVVLLVRRRPAIYVPVIGGLVMIACAVTAIAVSGPPSLRLRPAAVAAVKRQREPHAQPLFSEGVRSSGPADVLPTEPPLSRLAAADSQA